MSVGTARQPSAEPSRIVYFDLETTGLSGGAGMLAFLAGVGEWTADGFRTTQFLMPSFAAERALLHALNAYLGEDAVLVTYNGRTFDVPVMELRGEMQRVPQVVCTLPHLDMLHAARRLWRMSEEGDRSCRLTHLEESVLGVGRVGDVGGFEIPAHVADPAHAEHRFLEVRRSTEPIALLGHPPQPSGMRHVQMARLVRACGTRCIFSAHLHHPRHVEVSTVVGDQDSRPRRDTR